MNLLFQVTGGWGDKRKFKWMWRWFSNRVNPTVWQTHGIAFLTREYQLFYSIKVNEMCLLLEMLLAYTAHQLLAFFSQWYMVNGEDLLPVSPERARDQLLLSGSLVVMMVELQELQGGGLQLRKRQLRDVLLLSQLRYAPDRQDFCFTQVRRSRRRWKARLSLREMARCSWAGSSCMNYSVCKALPIWAWVSRTETMEGAEYGTLRPDVISICCSVLVPGHVAVQTQYKDHSFYKGECYFV